jgi:hypothetical protein
MRPIGTILIFEKIILKFLEVKQRQTPRKSTKPVAMVCDSRYDILFCVELDLLYIRAGGDLL